MKRFPTLTAVVAIACGSSALAQSPQNPVDGFRTTYGALGVYQAVSPTLSTVPLDVFPAKLQTARIRVKLTNEDYATASGGNGITIWCRWNTVAQGPAAPRGPLSWPIYAGGGIDDSGAGVNQGALNCVAESGTPMLLGEQY